MKKKKDNQSGMITLEMMFIFPVVFFLVMTLCYLTFYLCDYVRLQGLVANITEEQVICIKDKESLFTEANYKKRRERGVTYFLNNLSLEKNTLVSTIKNMAEKETLFGKVESVTASLSHTKVEIQLNMAISTGIPKVHEYLGGTPYRYQLNTSVPIHNPTEFTRAYTALQDTMESAKGFKKIKEKIDEIKNVKE
ncbi:MAG: pilus assembly protein [Lachnospiraceae bacterium]|nr:pilus assembly protein [Lachnospiraceae bacterium]